MVKSATKKGKIIALCVFIAVFIGLLFFLFSGENFNVLKEIFNTNATRVEIQSAIGKLGIRAYIVVFILSMLQVVMTFIPAEPLHVIAGISFGLWKGMAVCLSGILVGNTIIFILYKIYGSKLTEYFQTNVDFDFNTAKVSNRIALIVIILYVLPAIPYGIICFFATSMGLKYPKYILVTGLGSIPSLVLDVGLGHIAMSTSWTISIIVFVVIVILLILMYKYKTQIFKKINDCIRKNHEKEKMKVGKFNPFVYNVSTSVCFNYVTKKMKLDLKNNVGELETPSIVLCNHGSFYDFLYSGKLLKKYRPHFIVARMYFHNKYLKWLLDRLGAFPKSMFSNDLTNSKNCLKVIQSGQMLAMMPEARLSTVGKFEGIQDATIKFIQKMNVTVYAVNLKGDYLACPKWGDKTRKGAVVEGQLDLLFKAGELKDLSLDEVKDRVNKALDYNEWEWLESRPEIEYNHKTLAVGLENILYKCPSCGEICSFTTDKSLINCSKCGLQVEIDNRYKLHGVEFNNIADWYDWQNNELCEEIKNNPNYALESEVELRHLSTNGKSFTRHSGFGKCTLDRTGLRYVGTEDGKEIDKFFPIEGIYRLLFGAGEDFEIYENNELYYFVPENKRSAVMWYVASWILKEKLGC